MIFHDRFTIGRLETVQNDGGDLVTTTVVYGPYPCEVRPLKSSEVITASTDSITTTLRLACRGDVVFKLTDKITWRGNGYDVVGQVEPHTLGGRVHHQETLIRSYAGA